jgi:hypothetical protein
MSGSEITTRYMLYLLIIKGLSATAHAATAISRVYRRADRLSPATEFHEKLCRYLTSANLLRPFRQNHHQTMPQCIFIHFPENRISRKAVPIVSDRYSVAGTPGGLECQNLNALPIRSCSERGHIPNLLYRSSFLLFQLCILQFAAERRTISQLPLNE